jgi:hypothetical protein
MTNDARHTREIKSRIAMENVAFNKMKALFTSKLDLNIKNKIIKYYILSIVLYGAETWTLRKLNQIYVRSIEMWCWRRLRRAVGPIV